MRKIAFLLCTLVPVWTPGGYSQTSALNKFLGDWQPIASSDELTRVTIRTAKTGLTVHVWGACLPTACDWGEVAATPGSGGETLSAEFRVQFEVVEQEFNVLSDGSLQVSERSQTTDDAKPAPEPRLIFLTKGTSRGDFRSLPGFGSPAASDEGKAAALHADAVPHKMEERALEIPALSYGSNNWSIVKIKNPAAISRRIEVEIYRDSGERLPANSLFDLHSLETLEIVIEPRVVTLYRRDGQHLEGLNPPRILDTSLGGALSQEGSVWMKVVEPLDDGTNGLEVTAVVEVRTGNEVVDFARLPKEAFELGRWIVRSTAVRGNDLYFLNVSERQTILTFCGVDRNKRGACQGRAPERVTLKPNQAVAINVKRVTGRYFSVESSTPGKAIVALFTGGTGTRRVFSSQSSISFDK